MALDAKVLGTNIYAVRKRFNGKTQAQLKAEFGSIDNAQLQMAIQEMQQVLSHIQAFGEVSVSVTTAGTATNQAGVGTGKMK